MDIFVGRLMSSPARTVQPHESVQAAAQIMRDDGIGSVVVVDESNHLEGILTVTDILDIAADDLSAAREPVSAHMSTDVTTTTATASCQEVADTMTDQEVHHVPVVDDYEGVVGMITSADLTEHLSHIEQPRPAVAIS